MKEIYLGDGAYAKLSDQPGEVVIYTTNGLVVTNSVFLGRQEIQILVKWLKEKE